MNIVKEVEINKKQYAKYSSLYGGLIRKNKWDRSKTRGYEIAMPSEHCSFFEEKMAILLDSKSELYSDKKGLSELEINTMLAIAFACKEDYKIVYNGETVYIQELIQTFDDYLVLIGQIDDFERVNAEFYLANESSKGKKSKIILSDANFKLKTLLYVKELYRCNALQICEDIFTLFGYSWQNTEIVNKLMNVMSKDTHTNFSSFKKIEFNTFYNYLIACKSDEIAVLIEDFKKTYPNKPKKQSDREGIYLGHIYKNLHNFLEEETKVSKREKPDLQSSEQHRIIHYICALAGVVKFQSNFTKQAQTVKDILRNRLNKP